MIYSASLHRGRYLKNRRLQVVTLDRLEPIISCSKSNNSLSGSTSDDRKFGWSHKMRFAEDGSKFDILTQFRSFGG